MKREKKPVQKLKTETVLKALRCCMKGECDVACPLYNETITCRKYPALIESALAIIEGEEKRKEKALADYAERILSHYPHTRSIWSTIYKELHQETGGSV